MSLRLVKQRSKLRRTAAAVTDDGSSSRAAEERITSFSAANAGRLPFIWRTLTPKTSRTFTSFLSFVVVVVAAIGGGGGRNCSLLLLAVFPFLQDCV